ncbi:hypothetical protein [Pararhizobium mangrovi]|uniref:Uncharacterized protein n=1 Tax=Pararhizobium mangrovi TaxID=2590452 RepID=A0A506TWQ6_9HYPH|nr:hypothetical protein [Pararhizobium mangrovi]TPW25940.1 hypothetical protein FJU11_17105 [Pararhizobium mangrovi]
MADPSIDGERYQGLVKDLMSARRAVQSAQKSDDEEAVRKARGRVDTAKRALGERGPVWWSDGARDYTRCLAKNTPYADWYSSLSNSDGEESG